MPAINAAIETTFITTVKQTHTSAVLTANKGTNCIAYTTTYSPAINTAVLPAVKTTILTAFESTYR